MTTPAASDPKRNRARELAQTHVAQGDLVGWFEPLYAEAEGDPARVPWADLKPNPNPVEWVEREAARGFRVTAFDIAPSAVAWCQRRHPRSSVRYTTADLLNPPPDWSRSFDFV